MKPFAKNEYRQCVYNNNLVVPDRDKDLLKDGLKSLFEYQLPLSKNFFAI